MSAHSSLPLPRDQQVLGELLHSLSQPLTTLRCSLELSIDEAAEQQQQAVSAALQQTETVIGMIQLMREFLDAERSNERTPPVALAPILRSVTENLTSIAEARGLRLRSAGRCTSEVHIPVLQLRKALEYLVLATIERQPAGSEITMLLAEGPAGIVLRVHGEREISLSKTNHLPDGSYEQRPQHNSARSTMRRVRLAIAARVFESAGGSLSFDDGAPGFVLRISRSGSSAA